MTYEHKDVPANKGVNHVPYDWTYANAAARTGASGFVSADVGKLARQTDNNTLWMLTATTPTWTLAGGNLGTAALLTAGTGANNVVQLTAAAKLPAVDGSLLTNLPAGGLSGMQVFTSSGTFTVPAGVTVARVICVGGGGGSAGASLSNPSGSGGGGGYSEKIVTGLTPGSTVTVTVGAGGTAGTSTTNGGTGGTSSFGAHVSAPGGAGGTANSRSSGAGGTPTTSGALNVPGENGRNVATSDTYYLIRGGKSHVLTAGLDEYTSGNKSTTAGSGYGCGSAGGNKWTSAYGGSAGAAGVVIVQW